ncbi:MAG: RraA family protein [Gammaproteobacteria bacterium]|nr:RraA family protein [Gammaproteobacteria bacterium]
MEPIERLLACYTSAIHDVMVAEGLTNFVLPRTIQPLQASQRIAGPIYTVSGKRDDRMDPHETLLAWTKLLGDVPPGHVLVCQPNDDDLAFMGELSAEVLQKRGLIGYVADGGCRDVEIIKKSSFPVYCRYHTPTDIVGKWIPQELGEPIRIGHVDITTGDFLLADADGIVVLPSQHLTTVLEKTEVVINTENQMRKAIRGGMKPQAAYLKYKKF